MHCCRCLHRCLSELARALSVCLVFELMVSSTGPGLSALQAVNPPWCKHTAACHMVQPNCGPVYLGTADLEVAVTWCKHSALCVCPGQESGTRWTGSWLPWVCRRLQTCVAPSSQHWCSAWASAVLHSCNWLALARSACLTEAHAPCAWPLLGIYISAPVCKQTSDHPPALVSYSFHGSLQEPLPCLVQADSNLASTLMYDWCTAVSHCCYAS